jgi:hypothetical protein
MGLGTLRSHNLQRLEKNFHLVTDEEIEFPGKVHMAASLIGQ